MDLVWLAVVSLEWLALGWLSGLAWPGAQAPLPMRLALHLLVGAALLGLALVVWLVLGLPLGVWPLVLFAAAGLALRLRIHGRPAVARSQPSAPMELREVVGWGLLGALLVGAAVRSWSVPEAGWDAYSHWGLKARAYFEAGGFVATGTAHEYYPPLMPLLESWLFVHRGAADIDVAKNIWPLVGSAFILCLAWQLRLTLQIGWLAPYPAVGVLLGTTQLLESFGTGQADLLLTTYLCLATLALFQWQRSPERTWLIQAAVFASAAALSKHEGLFRVGVLIGAVLLEASLARRPGLAQAGLLTGAVALACFLPWATFRLIHDIQVTSEHMSTPQPEAIGTVLLALAAALGGVRTGGGILVAVLASVVAGARTLEPPFRLLSLVVSGQLVATIVAFLITDFSPELQVQLSATRLFQHWMPIALFAAAIWLAEYVPREARAPQPSVAARDPETASV